MRVIIDRFEGDYAVVELENKDTVDMPKILIPKDAEEGDVLEIRIDKDEASNREERIRGLLEDLWE